MRIFQPTIDKISTNKFKCNSRRQNMQDKESIIILSLGITVRHNSAYLVMPNSYPRDLIFNPHLTTIKESYQLWHVKHSTSQHFYISIISFFIAIVCVYIYSITNYCFCIFLYLNSISTHFFCIFYVSISCLIVCIQYMFISIIYVSFLFYILSCLFNNL